MIYDALELKYIYISSSECIHALICFKFMNRAFAHKIYNKTKNTIHLFFKLTKFINFVEILCL